MRQLVQSKFETFSEPSETHGKVSYVEKPKRPKWNGAALKELRKQKGWKPEDLAKAVGCNKSQVYKWEGGGGDKGPGIDFVAAFSVLFDRSPMTFVTGLDAYRDFVLHFNPQARSADEKFKQEEATRRKKREEKGEAPIEFVAPKKKVSALSPPSERQEKPPMESGAPTQRRSKRAPKSPQPTDK